MNPVLFFDIETTANPDAIAFLPEPAAQANYKDADKIAQYISDKKAEQIVQAPLDADLGKVIAIGMQFGLENQVEVSLVGDPETTTEADLIKSFWSAYNRAAARAATTSSVLTCRTCCAAHSSWGSTCRSFHAWQSTRPNPRLT